jgi:hypothetical protein
VKFALKALEGKVIPGIIIPGLLGIPIDRSPMEQGLEILGAKEWALLILSTPFALETPFSFDSDLSTTRSLYVTINIAIGNLMSFLVVFKLFNVCIFNSVENRLFLIT